MYGIDIKNIQDTRAAFTSVFSDAAKGKAIVCQNGKSLNPDKVIIISDDMLREILSMYTFKPEITFNDESKVYEGVIDEIRVYTYSDTKEQLIEDLLDMIEISVEDYLENVSTYLQFDNHRKKYPYILKLAHCKDRDEMRKAVFDGNM